jgi:signal transduction histidine kinase
MTGPDPMAADAATLETQARMSGLGMLVAGVAHELSNPLGYVKSNTEFLQSLVAELLAPGVSPDRVRQGLEEAAGVLAENADGLRRLARITSELKRVARDAGDAASCDLDSVLERALLLTHNLLKYKADVILDLRRPSEVRGDEGRLSQVFVNLLANAAQAIEGHGEIRVATREEDGFAVATVADTGRGIAPEHLGSLFKPFFTTKPPGEGTGLGLWVTRRIVEAAGGTIAVDSEPGRGTTFTVRLPVVRGV